MMTMKGIEHQPCECGVRSSALEVTRRRVSEKESCTRALGIARQKKDLGSQEGATRGLFYTQKKMSDA